jgi:hypothetical protein
MIPLPEMTASTVSAACALFMLAWNVVPVLWRKAISSGQNAESRPGANFWKQTVPLMAIFVVLAWVPWIFGSLQSKPMPQSEVFGFTPVPPQTPRTKQAINELLDESGKLSNLVSKTGVQLASDWQTLTNKNPERICLDLDSRSFRNEIETLALRFRDASITLETIYDQNRIDQPEFNRIFPHGNRFGFVNGLSGLEDYSRRIAMVGDHPTCDDLVRSGKMLDIIIAMDRYHQQYNVWIGGFQENLNRYRDNLRTELRKIP